MSHEKYKVSADIHRRYKRFDIGDFVMIRLSPERFPPGTFRKLQARGMGPFEVLSKVGENGYIIDIPNDLKGNWRAAEGSVVSGSVEDAIMDFKILL